MNALGASKLLSDLGMRVASVSLLCADDRVKEAMKNAGTPCPINGKIGDEARLGMGDESCGSAISEDQKNLVERLFDEQAETKIGLGCYHWHFVYCYSYSNADPYSYWAVQMPPKMD